MQDPIEEQLALIRSENRFRTLRCSEGLDFSHNDYLGIASSGLLVEKAHEAVRIFGSGSRGSRLLGGQSRIFDEAERAIAEFFKAPAALFFSSGYLANIGLVSSLAPLFDTTYSDELNHASLIDGIRLAGVAKKIFPHNELRQVRTTARDLIVTESLFSQDGDFVDETALNNQAAFVVLDQAHAAGVFFEDGLGVKRDWSKTAMTVTFGKAFGVGGACVLCTPSVRDLLINSARSFIFSTAAPPVVPHLVMESLKIIRKDSWRREALWEVAEKARDVLSAIDPKLSKGAERGEWARRSPIIPIRLGSADRALRFSENMRKSGFEVRAIRFPTVKVGEERIRVSLNLSVSRDNTLSMAEELVRLWTAFL